MIGDVLKDIEFQILNRFSFIYRTDKNDDWPSYCYILGWLFTWVCILLGMGMVAMYGIQFGNEKTYAWVTAMFVNFFWNVFVESPKGTSAKYYSNIPNSSWVIIRNQIFDRSKHQIMAKYISENLHS